MTTAIDLSPEYIVLIKAILKLHLPSNAQIWLFGSRTQGNAKRFSDVDLLVDLGKPISLELLAKLNLAFEESALPYKVDIADACSISPAFYNAIENQLVPF